VVRDGVHAGEIGLVDPEEFAVAFTALLDGLSIQVALEDPVVDPRVAEQVEIATKYAGYIERQQAEVERRRVEEDTALPVDLDYADVRGLSVEVRQKLTAQRPETVGQAARISGITPAAISLLLVHLKRRALAARDAPRVSA
jgi:tRNA uridine 5-carboxymethylaminomethyl modification enzyme